MKKIVSVFLVLCMLLACTAAAAEDAGESAGEIYVTEDGVLSIQAPNENWTVISDPDFWFVMTDGADYILLDHLSNGEALPSAMVANDEFSVVYHAYVSTANEVFVIEGCAVEQEQLQDIMEAISTIRILEFDTKLAIGQKEETSEFVVEPFEMVAYSTSPQLNIRSSWSVNSDRLGYLKKGQAIEVTGVVLYNGGDFGWVRVSYNGGTAYVSSQYLSATKPSGGSGSKKTTREDPIDNVDTQDPLAGYTVNSPELYEDPIDNVDTQDPLAD